MILIQNQQINFRANVKKLVPISEYKGPTLKLTPKEQMKVSELLKTRAGLELELVKVKEKLEKNTKHITAEYQRYEQAFVKLQGMIEKIEKLIKDIKINRFQKQLKSWRQF